MKTTKDLRAFATCQRLTLGAGLASAVLLASSAWAQPVDCGDKTQAYPAGIYHGCLPTKCMMAWAGNSENEGRLVEMLPTTDGSDKSFTYPSGQIGYTIYLPPDYLTNTSKRYPVIYYLDGVGEDCGPTTALSAMGQVVRTAVSNGMPSFIYVWVEAGTGGMYADWGPNCTISSDGDYDSSETFLIKELIPYIDKTYRTIASKSGRSIEGFSMGGCGSLRFAYKYPEMFSSVVSYACSIYPPDYPRAGMPTLPIPVSKADLLSWCKYNQNRIRGNIAIWLRAGTDDPGNIWYQAVHSRFLDSLKITHKIDSLKGQPHEIPKLYPAGGLAGLKFHAATWDLSATGVMPHVNKSRQTMAQSCVISVTGTISHAGKGSAVMKVFGIRGNNLGSGHESGSRSVAGVLVVQQSGR